MATKKILSGTGGLAYGRAVEGCIVDLLSRGGN